MTARGARALGPSGGRRGDRGRSQASARGSSPGLELTGPRARLLVALLLAAHAALAIWGATRNSVTFDENLHLPAGVLAVTRGDFSVSPYQPPLLRSLCALPVIAMGAAPPADSTIRPLATFETGESFMRLNAGRYPAIYFAGRLVVIGLSVLLGWFVWRLGRRLYGRQAGLVALALYAFAPEALAHAGVVGMDLATALGFFATLYAFWGFSRTGRWNWWAFTAIALGATAATRFTAALLGPTLIALYLVGLALGRIRRPRRVAAGILLLGLAALLSIQLAYRFQTTFRPLGSRAFISLSWQNLAKRAPALQLPLPDEYLTGLDQLSFLSEPGKRTNYLFGRVGEKAVWYYLPIGLAVKWPLGFLGLILVGSAFLGAGFRSRRRAWQSVFLLLPIALILGFSMFAVGLNAGIRYVLPVLPLACVALGGLMRRGPTAPRARLRWSLAIWGLVAIQAVETLAGAPWYLAFYNRAAGGPGGGFRIVNDADVDWGQGLLALRGEMRRRGIQTINLSYHGTTDPAVYGIDYVPYLGGELAPGTEWLAVSSYFYVGLPQRFMTPQGRTEVGRGDFTAFDAVKPVARPAGCMMLFHLPRAGSQGP